MPYSGITSKELCMLLGLSRQMIKQSGISEVIPKSHPFGPRFPLYDEHEAQMWKMALNRRKALIAFGRLNEKAPLLGAIKIDPDEAGDEECIKCHGWAYVDDIINPARQWCPKCSIITSAALRNAARPREASEK